MYYKKDEIKAELEDYLSENQESLMNDKGVAHWHEDLHHDCFNTNYFIIGTYQAKQWLGDEVFNIINFIKEYEMDNFGEVSTDFSDPEKVVNMYAYIIGEQVVYEYINENQKYLESVFCS
tara:strand:+ start:4683 stop:5042 length:360 start_codon:yes stop_codon:yes gene_type:complete